MKAVYDRLPPERRGAYGAISHEITAALAATLRNGDVVMIKGSLGTNMAPLVAAVRGQTV
jgi:UDP-N-acetylmuramoyl-tripeptide--D-alanyl-D-alanine ligase